MELINTGNDLFDPISELFFLDHPGFYPAATPAHCRVAANPEILHHLNGPLQPDTHRRQSHGAACRITGSIFV
jgi:hypothetical protein